MIETSVELDEKALSRALTVLDAFGTRGGRAVMRSVNRALTAMKAVAGRAAREQFTVRSVKDVKSSLRVSKAAISGDVIEGRVESRGTAIPGGHFKFRPRSMNPAQKKDRRRQSNGALCGTQGFTAARAASAFRSSPCQAHQRHRCSPTQRRRRGSSSAGCRCLTSD